MNSFEALKSSLIVHRAAVPNPENQLLIIKRSPSASYNRGLWEFPGGKIELGETLEQALRREYPEETSVDIEPVSSPLFIEERMIPDGPYQGMLYILFCSVAKLRDSRDVTLSEEHTHALWLPVVEVLEKELTVETQKSIARLTELGLLIS